MASSLFQIARHVPSKSELAQRGIGLYPCLLLLSAGALKVWQVYTEHTPHGAVWQTPWFRMLVANAELIFGLWLLGGFYPRTTRWIGLIWFLALLGVSTYQALSGAQSCECFGRFRISPWQAAVLDLGAVFSLWLSNPKNSAPCTINISSPGPRLFAVSAVVLAVFTWVGVMREYPATLGEGGTVIGNGAALALEPSMWIGKRCPLLIHTDIGSELAIGKWVLLLYHRDCPACRRVMDNYADPNFLPSEVPEGARVAFIEVPAHRERATVFARDFSRCTYGCLKPDKRWYVSTPVLLELDNGQVKSCKPPSAL